MPEGPSSVIGTFAPSLIVFSVLVLALYGAWQLLGGGLSPLHDEGAQPQEVVARGNLAEDERTTIELFREVSPTVVNIASIPLKQRGWSRDPTEIPSGMGSGFTWGDDGYIVTNYHVVMAGATWTVTLADNSSYDARLVGYAARYDLAVLKIEAPTRSLRPIRVGSSRDLLVGQKVFAVGNPFGIGLTHSLTTGVISGLGRKIRSISGEEIEDVIQTDAAINFGNSGGPLFDSAARLIGVNTAIIGTDKGAWGIGFAVPVDTVNRVVPMIISGGTTAAEAMPSRAGLGVYIASESFVQLQGLEGVVIEQVIRGGAAEKAGLQSLRANADGSYLADVIKSIDGEVIRTNHDLLIALKNHEPGENVSLVVERAGVERKVELALDKLPGP